MINTYILNKYKWNICWEPGEIDKQHSRITVSINEEIFLIIAIPYPGHET